MSSPLAALRALLLVTVLAIGGAVGCTTDPDDSGSESPQGELDDVGPEEEDPIIGGDGAGGEQDARPMTED